MGAIVQFRVPGNLSGWHYFICSPFFRMAANQNPFMWDRGGGHWTSYRIIRNVPVDDTLAIEWVAVGRSYLVPIVGYFGKLLCRFIPANFNWQARGTCLSS